MRVCHVLHTMGVGGAEMLVARMIGRRPEGIDFCVAVLDKIGDLGERVAATGIPVERVGRRAGVDLSLLRRLRHLYARLRPDLLHCHQYTPWFYGGWAGALSKLPVVFTEHGRHQPDHRRWRRVLFNRYLLAHTQAIVAVSHSIRDALVENEMLPARRIEVVYNGVDEQTLYRDEALRKRMRKQLGIPADTLVIGHAGRLMPVKNQSLLLRALALLRHKKPELNWLALLAGGGALQGALSRQCSELALEDRVHFLGQRSDVRELLCAFDLFALPSFSEGTSVTLLEAMACGLPIVATAVGGNPELVEDGKQGWLVPSDDAESFATALLRLVDADRRARMGEAARREVEARFTEQGMTDSYLSIYDRVLAGEGARR
jgi:sugar transferase (PEP-CTERM/EpsH1 system associated)